MAAPSPAAITTATSTSNGSFNTMLAGINAHLNIHLIIGTNPLASARCTQSLSAGALPILIAPSTSDLHYNLQTRIAEGLITWKQAPFEDSHIFTLGRQEVDHIVDAVFVTSGPRDAQAKHISELCKRNRIPVNVVDAPHLCTFSLLSTHTDGPLQIGVTTNGRGCKLASRIRREVASSLPPGLGSACGRLGQVRKRIQQDDCVALGDLEDSVDQGNLFNKLVTEEDVRSRRMRWLSQMCEYWPLKRLASINDQDVDKLLAAYPGSQSPISPHDTGSSSPNTSKLGNIILAGSGPGHPDLLTTATLRAIQTADFVLADKLVPSGVLDLIPRRTPVQIARKFPGNADKAQEELLEAALQGVQSGKTVLRLKQGDPFIYGRGGEEVSFFNERGMGSRVTVLPGVTSALSASLFASIPATQRDVADQVLICTGTGKKGKPPSPPPYVATQTVVFLMALHRISGLVTELTTHIPHPSSDDAPAEGQLQPDPTQIEIEKKRALFPLKTPCAVIERASCPDQRVIRTTLQHVAEAIESEGSRPPGLLVVGRACEVLFEREKGRAWAVEEGFKGLGTDVEQDKWLVGLQAVMAGPET
ncbi:uroporphyrin-III C-methyltransferase [Conoideocrella luteorostrata]|uniref:Uroporphyrin-III C-methyltransferase n=1 Tax=Conoideocrella luteorostrata TaxID=1105319 RepID=A0AAJ0CB03_9HYPO|nr:uroporphyrin-III C-methyltransferase [Conoideocrella luteorostrata]